MKGENEINRCGRVGGHKEAGGYRKASKHKGANGYRRAGRHRGKCSHLLQILILVQIVRDKFGNLYFLADRKTGAKRINSSAKEVDKLIVDITDKIKDPDRGTN